MISIRNLTKRFAGFTALEGVTLAARAGETIVVLGPSGSGKSTLVRLIAGLEVPDSGEITVGGTVGMVFQSFHLFPHLTILENLTLAPRKVLGRSKAQAEDEARAQLQKLRIADQADKLPAALSGGQQQRAAIARALMMSPQILCFDEPTSALDPESVADVLDAIRELAHQGWTLVVVSHSMGFAKEVASRVAFFDGGRLIEIAPPDEFFASPREPRTKDFLGKVLRY